MKRQKGTAGSAHILVAEDSLDDQLFLGKALEHSRKQRGFSYFMVENGVEAQKYLSGREHFADRHRYPMPGLVLADIKMPICHGLELLEWIRQHPVLRDLPVLMLTSSDMPADVEKAYALGANTYFVKPTAPAELVGWAERVTEYWLELAILPEDRAHR